MSKLETETLWEGVLAEGLYVVVFFVIILVINRIGKFPILRKFPKKNYQNFFKQLKAIKFE